MALTCFSASCVLVVLLFVLVPGYLGGSALMRVARISPSWAVGRRESLGHWARAVRAVLRRACRLENENTS